MIVQCPKCPARYRLEEKQFAGRAELNLRCPKCGTTFPVKASAAAAAPAAKPSHTPMPEATIVSKKGGGLQLPADKRVALSVTQGALKGKVFTVSKARVVLGRQGTDIVVDDPEVSRKHCAVEVRGTTALLVDLGSTNGTFVNENRVETHELEHLSEFRIGDTTLMFTVSKKE
ncbi:MAG: zinc-ribbon domain-containing protein [Acidobacteria bacterium]|nr:zinc-ribbon domain-containing protein [Acidobacteriota bacterium]